MIRINNISYFSCLGPRPNQEDYIIASDNKNERIFLLCDGMGGHGHGEIASSTIAQNVYSYLSELKVIEYTAEHIQDAVNYAIRMLASSGPFSGTKAPGTTLVVVAINRMNIIVGHIGDSRCYVFSSDGIRKFRTKDHSKVQEAVDAEILTEDEAWSSPKKNLITRCILSTTTSVDAEIDILTIEDNDTMLLCSDGITDAMRDSELQAIMIDRNINDCAECIKSQCESSSHDNYSGILISFSQDEENIIPLKSDTKKHDAPSLTHITSTPFERSVPPQTRHCPHCGANISMSATFCSTCGKSVTHLLNSQTKITFDKILKYLSEINPLILIGGGIILGGLLTWGISTIFSEPKTSDEFLKIFLEQHNSNSFKLN